MPIPHFLSRDWYTKFRKICTHRKKKKIMINILQQKKATECKWQNTEMPYQLTQMQNTNKLQVKLYIILPTFSVFYSFLKFWSTTAETTEYHGQQRNQMRRLWESQKKAIQMHRTYSTASQARHYDNGKNRKQKRLR